MPHPLTPSAPQLQPPLLGHGLPAVGPGRLGEQVGHGSGLFGRECFERLDLASGGGER